MIQTGDELANVAIMPEIPTYYDLFGVSRTATTEEIRAAYLSLLKQHHPDVAKFGGARAGSSDFVATLNASFAILRDRRKRAEYDARLAFRSATPRMSAPPRLLARERHSRDLSNVRMTSAGLALACIAVMAGLSFDWAEAQLAASFSVAHQSIKPLVPVSVREQDIASEAHFATLVPVDQATAISARCFRQARLTADRRAVNLCVVFDYAFLYWQGAQYGLALPPYFDDAVVHTRHIGAVTAAGEEAESGVAKLRELTFRALLTQVAATKEEPPSPEIVAAARAGETPIEQPAPQ